MSAPPPAAPIFRPTYDEWKDFAKYVRQIEPLIAQYGGCQVIPPPEWEHLSSQKDAAEAARQRSLQNTETMITPIRQHVGGRDGRFQALMEWCDPQPLSTFIEESVSASASVAETAPEDLDAKFWRSAAARPSPLCACRRGAVFFVHRALAHSVR